MEQEKNIIRGYFSFRLLLVITNVVGCFSLLAFTYYLHLTSFFTITLALIACGVACLVLQYLAVSGFEYAQSLLKRERPDYASFFAAYFLSFTFGIMSFVFVLKATRFIMHNYFDVEYKWLDF